MTSVVRNQANRIKQRVLDRAGDSDLEEGLKTKRKEWMPNYFAMHQEVASSNGVSEDRLLCPPPKTLFLIEAVREPRPPEFN